MNPGSMNRRVIILKWTVTGRDSVNAPIYDWVPGKTVWASMAPVRAEERYAAAEKFATRAVTFRTYPVDLAETDRLQCEGRTYQVTGLAEIGFREGLEVSAEWLEAKP